MDDLPDFIDDAQTAGKPAGSRQLSVEVHWPGPDGGFGPGALSGLYLAAPDPRSQAPVCRAPMQEERVQGVLRGDIFVVQDSPEREHYLLWAAVPAWRATDDQARLLLAGVVRHEAMTRVLGGSGTVGLPAARGVATAALVSAHVFQRMARQGPQAAEGWAMAEAWPRGVSLEEVVAAARENRPVAVGVLPGG